MILGKKKFEFNKQNTGLVAGLLLSLLCFFFMNLVINNILIAKMAAITVLMATWWFTNSIPLFVTALLPLIFYPILGIMPSKEVASVYINNIVFLFIGGFIIAAALEKWDLHKRMALLVLSIIGASPNKIILGFLLASAFLSMWMSNTATAIMMIPIGVSMIAHMKHIFNPSDAKRFSKGLLLAIAYACSIGGMATLVGTPPNLILIHIVEIVAPNKSSITFTSWLIMVLPCCLVILAATWFSIVKVVFPIKHEVVLDKGSIDREYSKLGKMSYEEKVVLTIFLATIFLWVFRKDLNMGLFCIRGWAQFTPYPDFIDDGTIALFAAIIMFFIPTKSSHSKDSKIISGDVINKVSWDVILLFGGGFALATGFEVTGFSEFIGKSFSVLNSVPNFMLVLFVCAFITFTTNFITNMAVTQMSVPILASIAIDIGMDPLLLMIPATLCASCAFAMPAGTGPNAVVLRSNDLEVSDMVKVGCLISVVSSIFIGIYFYFFAAKYIL